MSLLSRITSWLSFRSMENPRSQLDPWSNALSDNLDGTLASSGVRVGRERALTLPAYWRGINLITGTTAKLPLGVYKRLEHGSEPDRSHPAYRLIRRSPNEAQTAFVWKRQMRAHALCHGNGYSYVMRREDGTPKEILPLDPERTFPVRENGRLFYVHELGSGEMRKLVPTDVLHFKGFSYDGLEGVSAIAKAREALGLGLAMQTYGSVFFRNNARPSVVLQVPQRLDREVARRMRESWERLYGGLDHAHRTAVLEEGTEAKELSISAEDSQLIESRQFNLVDIANVLGLPPHKLGAATNISYSSLEQENQAYLDDAIDPWLVMDEEEFEAKLLGTYQRERETHFISYDRARLVQADLQQRGEYYTKAIMNGWMCPDEAREREKMNAIPGGLGKIFYRPGNLEPINADPDGPEGPAVAPGTTLLEVPDIRQEASYDCGPAAVLSVCRLFGVGPDTLEACEDSLETTKRGGTRPSAIIDLFTRAGLAVAARQDMGVVDLARCFAAGQPVLCPIQAGEEGEETVGHWVVVIGTGLGQVFVQDPASGPRMVEEADWIARWRDRDTVGVLYNRYGIAVGEEMLHRPVEVTDEVEGGKPGEDPKPGVKADAAGRSESGTPTPMLPVEITQDVERWGQVVRQQLDELSRSLAALTEQVQTQQQRRAVSREALQRLLADTLARMVRRVGTHARRAAKEPGKFLAWLDGLEAAHATVVQEAMTPVVEALRSSGACSVGPVEASSALLGELRERLLDVAGRCQPAELPGGVELAFSHLDTSLVLLDTWRLLGGEVMHAD